MGKKPTTPPISIPEVLVEAVKSKRVIPFLGAGASKESKNSAGKQPPDADQLRDILALKFFGKLIPNRDVMAVSEMAISSAGGTGLVYEAVRQAFEGFAPSAAHALLSTFNWRMIATTLYVPTGDPIDATRPAAFYDATAAFLSECGLPLLQPV